MRIRVNQLTIVTLAGLLILVFSLALGCSPPSSIATKSPPANSLPEAGLSLTSPPSKEGSAATVSSNQVTIIVAGYINHGPLQPTVRAIKEVLAKYGDKVVVTWVDMATAQGDSYFKEHGLTAHMNVIINGTSKYQVSGKNVDFQWFEGQQWNKNDLDTILANLVNKQS
jgi:hypothetical protein